MATLITNKIDFQLKLYKRHGEVHFTLIIGKILTVGAETVSKFFVCFWDDFSHSGLPCPVLI